MSGLLDTRSRRGQLGPDVIRHFAAPSAAPSSPGGWASRLSPSTDGSPVGRAGGSPPAGPGGCTTRGLSAGAQASPGSKGASSPSGGVPAAPGEPALDPAEQTALLPLLERLSSGDLRRVESEMLALMASGRLRTLAGRAMAAQALARIALLARADVCGAFATLMPLLPELPRLPEAAQLELQVTAALVFSWPDGRFLDAGRAHAYLAGAERLLPGLGTPELRASRRSPASPWRSCKASRRG